MMLSHSLAALALMVNGPSTLTLTEVATDLNYPWALQQLPNGGFLITERTGQLVHITPDGNREEIALDLTNLYTEGQAGLFDIELAPDFTASREIFISYACGSHTANNTCVARGMLSKQAPYMLYSLTPVFSAEPKKSGASHFGGRMTWLPDESLVVTLGDGFDYREQAQDLSSHLGKTVRLSRDGGQAQDNPYMQQGYGYVFTYGHRNSQGIVYDAIRDAIWQHEHGPQGGDEINRLEKGENYGWPMTSYGIDYTGAKVTPYTDLPGVRKPMYQWTPSLAPSDMALYSTGKIDGWHGNLLVTQLKGRRLQRFEYKDETWQLAEDLLVDYGQRLRAVQIGADGHIYLLTDAEKGKLLRLAPAEADRFQE